MRPRASPARPRADERESPRRRVTVSDETTGGRSGAAGWAVVLLALLLGALGALRAWGVIGP